MKDIARYGAKSRIPSGGFDRNTDGFAFSVYSPSELPSQLHVTRDVLKDVVDGVGGIVVGDRRFNECSLSSRPGRTMSFEDMDTSWHRGKGQILEIYVARSLLYASLGQCAAAGDRFSRRNTMKSIRVMPGV